MRTTRLLLPTTLCALGLWVSPATAQISVPSDGSDGPLVLNCCGSTTIDLANAITGRWDDPVDPENAGRGIYDPEIWAVVFKYQSVDISRNLTFSNHPSGAPVVWLVQGDVTINSNGTLNLSASGQTPGAGGGAGGTLASGEGSSSSGRGPGGGSYRLGEVSSAGSYGTVGAGPNPGAIYGNPGVFPLIGGSGGSAGASHSGTGGGGGVLVAAGGRINIMGTVMADGTSLTTSSTAASGSGGGIRLIADEVAGTGALVARGGGGSRPGGAGRIRIEANQVTLTTPGLPEASIGLPTDPLRLFPDSSTPVIRSVSLGGEGVPADPRPFAIDVTLATPGVHVLLIEAENVPVASTVLVRVVPRSGEDFEVEATFISGNQAASTWTASLDLPNGASQVGVRAQLP